MLSCAQRGASSTTLARANGRATGTALLLVADGTHRGELLTIVPGLDIADGTGAATSTHRGGYSIAVLVVDAV